MNTLNVTIRKRDGVVYEGQVYAVSSLNDVGPFDVLASHSNFVSNIKEMITIHVTETEKKEFQVVSGILSARSNLVEVFLGI